MSNDEDQEELEIRRAKLQEASDWLGAELRAAGIKVRRVGNVHKYSDCCMVSAAPTEEQREAYLDVYLRGIRKFAIEQPPLTATELCEGAEPRKHFTLAWARTEGINGFARQNCFVPCVDCSAVETVDWYWDDQDLSNETPYVSANLYVLVLPDKSTREVRGHLCRDCFKKLGAQCAFMCNLPEDAPTEGSKESSS